MQFGISLFTPYYKEDSAVIDSFINRLFDLIERFDGTKWTTHPNKLTIKRDRHCAVAIRLKLICQYNTTKCSYFQ